MTDTPNSKVGDSRKLFSRTNIIENIAFGKVETSSTDKNHMNRRRMWFRKVIAVMDVTFFVVVISSAPCWFRFPAKTLPCKHQKTASRGSTCLDDVKWSRYGCEHDVGGCVWGKGSCRNTEPVPDARGKKHFGSRLECPAYNTGVEKSLMVNRDALIQRSLCRLHLTRCFVHR